MEIIDYKDIDLEELPFFDKKCNFCDLYEHNGILLKMFRGLDKSERVKLFKKFQDLDGITIDGLIKPEKLIVKYDYKYGKEKKDFVGYTMKKFENSISVNDYFGKVKSYDCSDLFKVLKKASLILKDIHKNDIVYQDFSFYNILFDKNNNSNVKICDLDACYYNKNGTGYYSHDLLYYFNRILGEQFIPNSKNIDKLSMLLSLMFLLFHAEINNISDADYEIMSDKINTLKNLKEYFISLREGDIDIIYDELPYLHEVIDDNDHFIFS